LREIDRFLRHGRMADVGIVQKDEISLVRSARPDLLRKRNARITLLPDCATPCRRATVAEQ
jgi:hypothetical protein